MGVPEAACPSDDPPAWLAAELRACVGRLKRRVREQADAADLAQGQIFALLRLEAEGPLTVSALARAEGVRSQSMGAVVAPLMAKGFVESAPDPQDGRQSLLTVTPAYRNWINAGRAARQDWMARTIARELEPDEQALLSQAMPLLQRLVAS